MSQATDPAGEFPETIKAVWSDDLPTLRALLAAGADVDALDPGGRTALMQAAVDRTEGIALALLEAGAEVDREDRGRRWTALHFAAQSRAIGIAKALLAHGADVNHQEKFGNTPLAHAMMREQGNGPMTALLIRSGADVTIKNTSGNSPEETATLMGVTLTR